MRSGTHGCCSSRSPNAEPRAGAACSSAGRRPARRGSSSSTWSIRRTCASSISLPFSPPAAPRRRRSRARSSWSARTASATAAARGTGARSTTPCEIEPIPIAFGSRATSAATASPATSSCYRTASTTGGPGLATSTPSSRRRPRAASSWSTTEAGARTPSKYRPPSRRSGSPPVSSGSAISPSSTRSESDRRSGDEITKVRFRAPGSAVHEVDIVATLATSPRTSPAGPRPRRAPRYRVVRHRVISA